MATLKLFFGILMSILQYELRWKESPMKVSQDVQPILIRSNKAEFATSLRLFWKGEMIQIMTYRVALAVFTSLFIFSNSFPQNLASIEGRVVDANTKETLPGAAVYLANTAIGVAADKEGAFLLDRITNGKYDLTVSMLGYKVFTKPMVLDGNSIKDFVIYLV